MTELQVKAAQLAEEKRHNIETEKLSKDLNAAQARHWDVSDTYTGAHYERSDKAGLISANAAAMNASTNKAKYEMEYDIEYGWTGDRGYPTGMPLTAQRKSAELELLTLPAGSTMPAVDYTRRQKEADIGKTNAETLNKVWSAYNQTIGNIFGKGGIINTIDKVASD